MSNTITDDNYQKVKKAIELSKPQTSVFNARTAIILDMAGQRAGKSQMIGVLSGLCVMWFPKLRQFIAANTYLQLTQSTLVKATEIWRDSFNLREYHPKTCPDGDYVIDKVPPAHFYKFQNYKEYYNIISFRNGAVIYTGSLDNYMSHDGKEFGIAHLDETKQTREEAVTSVIIARLSQSGLEYDITTKQLYWVEEEPLDADMLKDYRKVCGADFPYVVREELANMGVGTKSWRPMYVHTSPALGTVDWLNKMFNLDKYEKEIRAAITQEERSYYQRTEEHMSVTIYSTHHNKKNLPVGYIEDRSRVLSEGEYLKLVCGYPFSKSGGEYFPYFQRAKHVGEMPYYKEKPTHLSFDYNYLPYMTGLANQINIITRYIDKDYVKWDEPAPDRIPLKVFRLYTYRQYAMKPPYNTVIHTCDAFKEDHPPKDVYLYGDSNGKSHIAGLGSYTHFEEICTQLARYLFDDSDRTPRSNMGVLIRRNIMNRIFEGKMLNVEVLIHPSCVELITDLEYLKLGANDKEPKHKELYTDPETGVSYQKLGHMSDAYEYFVTYIVKHFIESMN